MLACWASCKWLLSDRLDHYHILTFTSFATHNCSRTFVAVIVGIVVGILGVEGWIGFLPHFLAQLLVRLGQTHLGRHSLGGG
jgi:hypothetical protein